MYLWKSLEAIVKIVATRCQIVTLKCTKINFDPEPALQRSGLSPDPLAMAERPYDPILRGVTSRLNVRLKGYVLRLYLWNVKCGNNFFGVSHREWVRLRANFRWRGSCVPTTVVLIYVKLAIIFVTVFADLSCCNESETHYRNKNLLFGRLPWQHVDDRHH